MTQYLLILVSAFVLALGVTPVLRGMASRWGIVDKPAARKLHARPIPLMGGVAIYVAFGLALLALGDRFYVRQIAGILLGATLCSFLGLWDDRHELSALIKLGGQALAVATLIISDVRVQVFPGVALNLVLTILWVLGITNAMNLLDNMDGLSGGVGATAALFFLVLAAMSGQYLVGVMAAALVGACIGFLVYNINPATIFMGDAGSLFLGFMLAATGIKLRFPSNVPFVTWMIPVVVLGLPVFDTTLVMISRLRRGLNPLTAAGKDHVSHRLVKMGLTQREAVLTLYLVCCGLGVIAMFLTQASIVEGYVVGAGVLGAAIYVLVRLEQVGPLGSGGSAGGGPAEDVPVDA